MTNSVKIEMAAKKLSVCFIAYDVLYLIRIKALIDEDFIVCGFYNKSDNLITVILGMYSDSIIIYQSHVTMGISRGYTPKMKRAV